jgi:hypothetical protein
VVPRRPTNIHKGFAFFFGEPTTDVNPLFHYDAYQGGYQAFIQGWGITPQLN